LRNYVAGVASLDLFVVRTISFKLLNGLVILRHARRRLVTISVTANPTAEWITGQVTDAFPWDESPSRLIRDRDGAFDLIYVNRILAMGNRHHPTTPRSPWQNVYVERLIGIDSAREPRSPGRVRRSAVRRVLKNYASYTTKSGLISHRTRMRRIFGARTTAASIALIPVLGGLHHQYLWF
jgi:hypothetical protein